MTYRKFGPDTDFVEAIPGIFAGQALDPRRQEFDDGAVVCQPFCWQPTPRRPTARSYRREHVGQTRQDAADPAHMPRDPAICLKHDVVLVCEDDVAVAPGHLDVKVVRPDVPERVPPTEGQRKQPLATGL
jgi:hypothetical protein